MRMALQKTKVLKVCIRPPDEKRRHLMSGRHEQAWFIEAETAEGFIRRR